MSRFIFELESVLEARRAAERKEQLAVAELERQRVAIEEEIRAYQRSLADERDELRRELVGESARVQVSQVRAQASASLHIMVRAQQAVLRLAGVHKRLDQARLLLLSAATRRKAVEALRERRYELWLGEQKRRENAADDEMAVMRAGRQGGEE